MFGSLLFLLGSTARALPSDICKLYVDDDPIDEADDPISSTYDRPHRNLAAALDDACDAIEKNDCGGAIVNIFPGSYDLLSSVTIGPDCDHLTVRGVSAAWARPVITGVPTDHLRVVGDSAGEDYVEAFNLEHVELSLNATRPLVLDGVHGARLVGVSVANGGISVDDSLHVSIVRATVTGPVEVSGVSGLRFADNTVTVTGVDHVVRVVDSDGALIAGNGLSGGVHGVVVVSDASIALDIDVLNNVISPTQGTGVLLDATTSSGPGFERITIANNRVHDPASLVRVQVADYCDLDELLVTHNTTRGAAADGIAFEGSAYTTGCADVARVHDNLVDLAGATAGLSIDAVSSSPDWLACEHNLAYGGASFTSSSALDSHCDTSGTWSDTDPLLTGALVPRTAGLVGAADVGGEPVSPTVDAMGNHRDPSTPVFGAVEAP